MVPQQVPAASGAVQEWRSGWTLVLACFVGFSFFSIMSASLGMFMEPLGQEFGWSRTLISSGVTIASVTTAILSPFFGVLIDRYGSRRVAMPGIIAAGCAIAAFSLSDGSPMSWMLLWGVYAVISVSIKVTVWTTAVAGAFTKAQGLALGITLSGTAAAQTIAPPLAHWLIGDLGWRATYVWFGAGWGSVTLILCYLFLRDAKGSGTAKDHGSRPDAPGLTVAEAWRDAALWRIAVSTFLIMLLTIGLLIHQIPILNEAGVSRGDAAWLASMAGIAGIIGKLATGALLDRFRPNWVGGLTLAVTTFSFVLLIDGINTPVLIAAAMLVSGYASGTKLQICSYLTARYAGLRNYGTIFGVMHSLIALGSGLGPVIAGFTYDSLGNYEPFLIAGAVGCIISSLLLFSLPGYPDWNTREKARPSPA